MARPILLAALLLLCGGLPRARVAHADDGLSPAEVQRLKAEMTLRAAIPPAVERGVAWLAAQQRPDGSFQPKPAKGVKIAGGSGRPFGKTALATLSLAHCGRDRNDPAIRGGVDYLRKRYRQLMSGSGSAHGSTYGLSLFVMTLHELYAHREDDPAETETSDRNPLGLPAWALAVVREVGDWLLATRTSDGLFSYPMPQPRTVVKPKRKKMPIWQTRSDMSNTQYGLLGLWAATRCGYQVPKGDIHSISEALLSAQASGGPAVKRQLDPASGERPGAHTYAGLTDRARGFTYQRRVRGAPGYMTGSLTAGGLSSLLIAKAILLEQEQLEVRLERRLDHGIWDAIAWLTVHYNITTNPAHIDTTGLPPQAAKAFEKHPVMNMGMTWYHYYLYGLERACVIAGKRFLGERDWYLEGSDQLLKRQTKDGGWGPATPQPAVTSLPMTVSDTCFSLLFLQRATLRPRAPLLRTKRLSDPDAGKGAGGGR